MKLISTNKKLLHDYEVIEKYTAGLVLKWYEVKSIKSGYVNITNAWVKIDNDGNANLMEIDIPLYKKSSLAVIGSYNPKWARRLLLTKREITKLAERTHKTGSTVRVIDIYISHKGFIKLTIGITKVMKRIDKKNKLKEKDTIRETDREIKNIVFK